MLLEAFQKDKMCKINVKTRTSYFLVLLKGFGFFLHNHNKDRVIRNMLPEQQEMNCCPT